MLGNNYQDLIATSVEIWQDEKDPNEMFWHTDNREGMIRCLIYLDGGSRDSGAFKYMLGTHKRSWYCDHKLTEEQIKNMNNLIYIADNQPGTLVIADTLGFHANLPKTNRRRVLMIEFQPCKCLDYPRSNIYLKSSDLSQRVIENLNLFIHKTNKFAHGADYYFFNKNLASQNRIPIKAYLIYRKTLSLRARMVEFMKKLISLI